MDYALAKRLKDSGYPQPDLRDKVKYPAQWLREHGEQGEELVYAPYILELIEACGDDFDSLKLKYPIPRRWEAYRRYMTTLATGLGDTAEEAVANLWIALNPKK